MITLLFEGIYVRRHDELDKRPGIFIKGWENWGREYDLNICGKKGMWIEWVKQLIKCLLKREESKIATVLIVHRKATSLFDGYFGGGNWG